MGWISDLLGFGDDDDDRNAQTTTVRTVNEIPEYLQDFSKQQINFAQTLGETPFAALPNQLTQGFTGDQTQSFADIRANQGAWDPYTQGALTSATNVANSSFPTADLQGYMNPYLDSQKQSINRNFDAQQTQQDSRAVQSSAFGGNRRGIVDAELAGQKGRALSDVDRQAFDNAQRAYFVDQQTKLAGANALGGLSSQYQGQLAQDAAQLGNIGAQQQLQGQTKSDALNREYIREQEHPFQMFNVRQSALSGLPYQTTQAQTKVTPGGNQTAQNIGAIAGLASGVGSFFAQPKEGQSAAQGLGSALGSIGSFFTK